MGPAHNGNVFSVLYATGIRKKTILHMVHRFHKHRKSKDRIQKLTYYHKLKKKRTVSTIKGCRKNSNSVEALPNLTMLHCKAMPARFQVNHQHFRLNLCCFSSLAWIDANKLIEAKALTSAMPPKSPIASSFSSATCGANKGMKTSCEIQ